MKDSNTPAAAPCADDVQPALDSIGPTQYMASRPCGYGNATKPPNTGKPPHSARRLSSSCCLYLSDALHGQPALWLRQHDQAVERGQTAAPSANDCSTRLRVLSVRMYQGQLALGLSRRGNAASTGRIERGPALASISDRPARHNSSLFGLANRQPILSKSIGNARMANGAAER